MSLLAIDKIKYDALIVLAGDFPNFISFENFEKCLIVAADGAANKCINLGLLPNIIIGDIDSLELNEVLANVEIIQDLNQDTNDFEKILLFLRNKNIANVAIIGLNGGDYEHSLNNLSILLKYTDFFNFIILENERIGIPINNTIYFKIKIGETISIIPTPSAFLTTSGLKWNLDNEELSLGKREGARNKSIEENIEINLHKGSFILFLDNKIVKR